MCDTISPRELAKHKAEMSKRPKRATVEQAQNGGYIVTHDDDSYPPAKHTFNDHASMSAHLAKHFGKGGKK